MSTRSIAVILAFLVTTGARAEDMPATDDKQDSQQQQKESGGSQQFRRSQEQKRLDAAEAELGLVKQELLRALRNVKRTQEHQVNAVKLSSALEQFHREFKSVNDMVTRGEAPTTAAYQQMEASLNEVWATGIVLGDEHMPSEDNRSVGVLDELYGDIPRHKTLPSWSVLQPVTDLRLVGHPGNEAQLALKMKTLVSAAAPVVKTVMNLSTLTRLMEDDKSTVVSMWNGVVERARASIKEREQQIEQHTKVIIEIDNETARQATKSQTDNTLSYSVWFMVGALVLLFLATRLFDPSIQAIIFNQRTLVEMIGMAFLLLTIIVLGTGEKIDRAVLGTLLGTVGGYIFGQQIQASRRVAAEATERPTYTAPVLPPPAEGLKRSAEGMTGNESQPLPAPRQQEGDRGEQQRR